LSAALVSVLLPVRNGAPHLRTALRSLARQSLRDFEVLVLDDASSDGSADIAGRFGDARVRVVRHEKPQGLARVLNGGLAEARGEFIARMDADDVAAPRRLERQVAFLRSEPGVAGCGTWLRCFGQGRPYLARYPIGASTVRAYALFDNPLAHPSACWRHEAFREHGLRYDESVGPGQDYDLWLRALAVVDLDNVPEPLLRYRIHAGAVSGRQGGASDERARDLQRGLLGRLGADAGEASLSFHRLVGHGAAMTTPEELARAEAWLQHLQGLNLRTRVYDAAGLARAVGFVWLRVCLNSARYGRWAWAHYRTSPLALHHEAALTERLQLCGAALLSAVRGPGRGRPGLREAVSP
jgi:hypothetical protein